LERWSIVAGAGFRFGGLMRSATYVLPIRRTDVAVDAEMTQYLAAIARRCELIVVDGSPSESFGAADEAWSSFAVHVAPRSDIQGLNGKVRGVLTGIALATNERIIIADDDVRYDGPVLERTITTLDDTDLVRPQNYFAPAVWHANWDTARTLLNRVLGGADFPGTLAVRRSTMTRVGGYDADVLFENLELIRTVKAGGGSVSSPLDLYVRRIPPTARHFWSQRKRQAYDELARPWRFLISLAVVPVVVALLARRKYAGIALGGAMTVVAAELGRRRAGGRTIFPPAASGFAPLWILERSVCSWFAVTSWLRGGCPYAGGRLRVAATPNRVLRKRLRDRAVPDRTEEEAHERT
jgi:hypothetical protein